MRIDAPFLLAAAFEEKVVAAQKGSIGTRELLVGLTIALVVGFVLVLLVYLRFRKKTDEQDQERLSQIVRGQSRSSSTSGEESGSGHRSRKRRRRRAHRSRNPSLSETGGLPPVRPEDEIPKY
jgi:hypothetical protein